MNRPTPIFSRDFLQQRLSDYKLRNVTNIRAITSDLDSLVQELESGKFDSLKEEELKSRFVTTFFGDILGFNCGNSNNWQLREEKKSTVDGTKPDAALGYFQINKDMDDVRAVIEIKDAQTDLDTKLNKGRRSAVDQAFDYVSKMGGRCKWVIVSNIRELRFYPALDRSKAEVFSLVNLRNEDDLKRLLFLFHKDQFIHKQKPSPTDKLVERSGRGYTAQQSTHIVDVLYDSLNRFSALNFVDPEYIATIAPFNILDEHVWHYRNGQLFTINQEIHDLLEELEVKDCELTLSAKLTAEMEQTGVIDALGKLTATFTFLNHSGINRIAAVKDYKAIAARNKRTIGFSLRHRFSFSAGEGLVRNIHTLPKQRCECLICTFRRLDFRSLLAKLKASEGHDEYVTPEYAYGHYLVATNNMKACYNMSKTIAQNAKGKEGQGIQYYMAQQNIKHLHNLSLHYWHDDRHLMLNEMKSINLDKVIYDELEYDLDGVVLQYLIDLKDDKVILKLEERIDEALIEIEQLRDLYLRGGRREFGPDHPSSLWMDYTLLQAHITRNFIVYDKFSKYKSIAARVFKGLVLSYQTPESSLKTFSEPNLIEAILHVDPKTLQQILSDVSILPVEPKCVDELIEKVIAFSSSYFDKGLFSDSNPNPLLMEYLSYAHFQDQYTNIFANLFSILSRIDITKEQFAKCAPTLITFLRIESDLAWFDLGQLSNFIRLKGDLFSLNQLMDVLTIAINGQSFGRTKYEGLLQQIPRALSKCFPEFRVTNEQLISTAIVKCRSDNGKTANYKYLVPLVNVCDDRCTQLLHHAFEQHLDTKFDDDLYECLIRNTDYSLTRKAYFESYVDHINKTKGGRAYKFRNGEFTDLVFINFILSVYERNVDLTRVELTRLENLNEFERWLLNPDVFDYARFRPQWLVDLNGTVILDRLKGKVEIQRALDDALIENYHPILAELRFTHFK